QLFGFQTHVRLVDQKRPRGNRAKRNPDVSIGPDCRRDAQYRKVERSPAAQFPVTGWTILDLYLGKDFIGPAFQIIDAVVVVEILQRDFALARRRDELYLGAEREQRRRAVGGRHGHAALARRGDPADRAVLLQAEVDRLAPFVVLVVVIAARIEAQVAAEG